MKKSFKNIISVLFLLSFFICINNVLAVPSNFRFNLGAGNVGIGLTVPTTKLDVFGGIRSDISVTTPNIFSNNSNLKLQPISGHVEFAPDFSAGYGVGIGTNIPQAMLHLYKGVNSPVSFILQNDSESGFSGDTSIVFKTRSSSYSLIANDDSNNLYITDGNAVGGFPNSLRLSIGANGNVGIGSVFNLSAPQKLSVDGNIFSYGQIISNVAAGTAPFSVVSGTVVPVLNVDKVDGYDATAFSLSAHKHNISNDISSGVLSISYGGTGRSVGCSKDDILKWDGSIWECANDEGGGPASNHWTRAGNDVYYDAGNVGIGISTPLENLEVLGNARVTNFFVGDKTVVATRGQLEVSYDNTFGDSRGYGATSLQSRKVSRDYTPIILNYLGGAIGIGGEKNPQYSLDSKGAIKGSSLFAYGGQFISDTTLVAPMQVASTIVVTNFNADLLDGKHSASFENALTAGTNLQYYRGDKTWQTLNTTAVPEGTNLYFTYGRTIAAPITGYTATSGTLAATDTILQAIQKLGYDKHVSTTVTANSYGLTIAGQALTMAKASGSTTGALSSTDWTTFNSKQNALVTCITGEILKWGASNWVCGTDNVGVSSQWTTSGTDIYYSLAGNVGIGVINPIEKFEVLGDTRLQNLFVGERGNVATRGQLEVSYDNTFGDSRGYGATSLQSRKVSRDYTPIILNYLGGAIGIGGEKNPQYSLDSKGAIKGSSLFAYGGQFISDTTLVAPMQVASTIVVTNFNADLLDGKHSASFENALTAGTNLQYYRGDKTWQTLNTTAVPEGTNLYFTYGRTIAAPITGYTATSGTLAATDTILQAIQKLGYDKHVSTTVTANSYGLTIAGQALTMAKASGSTTGALSSTDWTTFNSKQNALVTCITGEILKWGASNWVCGTDNVGVSSQWTTSGTDIYYSLAGNVGIGVINPIEKFEVLGDTRLQNLFVGERGNVATRGQLEVSYDNTFGDSRGYGATSLQSRKVSRDYTPIILNAFGGGVAIGSSTTYGYTLFVGTGGIKTYGFTEAYTSAATYAMYSPMYNYSSDQRLKTNILPLTNSLSKILNVSGYSFNWKDTTNDKTHDKIHIGLIAQDIEKEFPELVSTDPRTGYKTVEYANMVAPLIEAMKEQQKQIDELKEEIRKLKEENKN